MGIKVTYYSPEVLYPIDDAHPEEIDYVVTSDISGDEIDDDEIWLVDGDVCSKEEMLNYFFDEYVEEVTDEKEYQKGKEWILKNFIGYTEEDFKTHPVILKINVPWEHGPFQYALEDNFNPIGDDFIPDDFRNVDAEDLLDLYDDEE